MIDQCYETLLERYQKEQQKAKHTTLSSAGSAVGFSTVTGCVGGLGYRFLTNSYHAIVNGTCSSIYEGIGTGATALVGVATLVGALFLGLIATGCIDETIWNAETLIESKKKIKELKSDYQKYKQS